MSESNIRDNICCPSCGSNNLKIIVEKENENYDLFSGILGMLCGLCCAEGEKKRTTCICNDCGMRFNG